MRSPVMPILISLALLGGDSSSGLVPRPDALALMDLLTQPADTGDSAGGRSRGRGALADAVAVRGTKCPMPVDRPDTAASEPMPTGRSLTARGAILRPFPSSAVMGMPVIRSGCWNPLDRPRGGPDSAAKVGGPRH